jgi:hypothetical protein
MTSNTENLLPLITRLQTWLVTKWDDSSSTEETNDERQPASLNESNVVCSLHKASWGNNEYHALLLDLDIPAYLVPSSTPGHSHLYVDAVIHESKYWPLIEALADAGVIEKGYADVSKKRGFTTLRLPWAKKS